MVEGSRSRRILVIEDDESQVRLLRELLEPRYEVHAVRCGTTALACVSDMQPVLIVLDLGLPDMDGLEVARKLRQTFHPWSLPILMLTGMNRPVDQLRGFAHGADVYLTKPCEPPELVRAVASMLGEADPEEVLQ